jgi:hypothetical protein
VGYCGFAIRQRDCVAGIGSESREYVIINFARYRAHKIHTQKSKIAGDFLTLP